MEAVGLREEGEREEHADDGVEDCAVENEVEEVDGEVGVPWRGGGGGHGGGRCGGAAVENSWVIIRMYYGGWRLEK